MPLIEPMNDRDCLGKLHNAVREFADTAQSRNLATMFPTQVDLIEYIRELDQRDDLGNPRDGPRISCDVMQRLRLPAWDPNCFERVALYLSIMLHIQPDATITSATIMSDNGLHTFPVDIRDGVPHVVVLDPHTPHLRNAMSASAYRLRNCSPMASQNIGPWFEDMTRNACADEGTERCYDHAIADIRNALLTGEPIDDIARVEYVLDIAHRDAQLFGPTGRIAYGRVHQSLRNLSIRLNNKTVSKYLGKLLKKAEPMAGDLLKAALIAKYGPAAQIALTGVDLAVTEPGQNNDPDAKPDKAEASKDDSDADDDAAEAHDDERERRDDPRQLMRRMTLAFRPPVHRKEN